MKLQNGDYQCPRCLYVFEWDNADPRDTPPGHLCCACVRSAYENLRATSKKLRAALKAERAKNTISALMQTGGKAP